MISVTRIVGWNVQNYKNDYTIFHMYVNTSAKRMQPNVVKTVSLVIFYFFFSPTFIWECTTINDTFRANMSTDKCVLNKRQIYSPLGLTSAATLYVRRSLAPHN